MINAGGCGGHARAVEAIGQRLSAGRARLLGGRGQLRGQLGLHGHLVGDAFLEIRRKVNRAIYGGVGHDAHRRARAPVRGPHVDAEDHEDDDGHHGDDEEHQRNDGEIEARAEPQGHQAPAS